MRLLYGLIAAALALTSPPAAAQQFSSSSTAPSPVRLLSPAKASERWRIGAPAVMLSSERDDNVFLLENSKKANVESPSAAEVLSRRYEAMESPSDVITTFGAELALKGPALLGRTLALRPSLRYELYARNVERRNLTLRLALEQELARGGELRLRARLRPSYFQRNYLADAVDVDGSRTIQPAERRYEAGRYRETEIAADYRYRIDKATKESPFGAALRLGAGYYARAFDAPFAGRDLSGPTAKLQLVADVSRRVEVDLRYELGALSASPADEVLILDEQDVGTDLNRNGSTGDADVRTVQRVDRSRTEHVVGLGARLELTRAVDLAADFERRQRTYGSREPLDAAYNGRSAGRNLFAAELSMKVSPRVDVALTSTVAAQSRSRDGDFGSTGEIDDYSRQSVGLRLGYRF
ncbi:MAG TPA: hypothetical protein VFS59_06350 [Gemmatimonadaceae bacterium]|nr:hypothetical protein [Gemmatimonadaceae bacterium]